MWLITLRDLQWRRRRFAVAILATALVLGLALLLSGVTSSFNKEVARTVGFLHADGWVVPKGAAGPITAPVPFASSAAAVVAMMPGVERADPLIFAGAVRSPGLRRVNLIGVVPGGVGSPTGPAARLFHGSGVAVADARLGADVGDVLDLSGRRMRVVGLLHGITYFAGQPVVVVPLVDAQAIAFDGQDLATAVGTRGVPSHLPAGGWKFVANTAMEADMVRPIAEAKQTVALVRSLLWLVAAGIVGAITYLGALERTRDFAVFKATGASNRLVVGSVLLQALAVSLAGTLLAFGIERALQPASAMSVEISAADLVTLPIVAVVVGIVASLAAVRKAIAVDPATAFAG